MNTNINPSIVDPATREPYVDAQVLSCGHSLSLRVALELFGNMNNGVCEKAALCNRCKTHVTGYVPNLDFQNAVNSNLGIPQTRSSAYPLKPSNLILKGGAIISQKGNPEEYLFFTSDLYPDTPINSILFYTKKRQVEIHFLNDLLLDIFVKRVALLNETGKETTNTFLKVTFPATFKAIEFMQYMNKHNVLQPAHHVSTAFQWLQLNYSNC